MKRLTILASAATVVLAALATPAAAQVVTNGGFETGDLSGWTTTGNFVGAQGSGFDGYSAHSGSFLAGLGDTTGSGSLSQTLSTASGQAYTLSYYLASQGDNETSFGALWNGSTIAGSAVTNPDSGGAYVLYQFMVTGTGSDLLTFQETDVPSYLALDDISLSPTRGGDVPEPATWAMMLLGFGAIGAAVRRKRNSPALAQIA